MTITLLDGPMGTQLDARGADTRLPLWSARPLREQPELVRAIHAGFAAAGASVHTTNTFRTRRRTAGDEWESLARLAVTLAREAVPPEHRVAGGLAPLEDCYRPDLSPPDPYDAHAELAAVLADAGCDLLLCETFPHSKEALAATRAALDTGSETWLALTAGPDATLLTPSELARTAAAAVELGASAVLVNCVAATRTTPYVRALAEVLGDAVPFGAYANAGSPDEDVGWRADPGFGAERYVAFAREWVDLGARLLGACCGTGPEHVAALRNEFCMR